MHEYVVTVSKRDPEHPLAAETLIEFGIDTKRPQQFIDAVNSLAGMIQALKTPERAADYIARHSLVQNQTYKLQPQRAR